MLLPTNQLLRFDAKSSETAYPISAPTLTQATYKPVWITQSDAQFNVSYLSSSNIQQSTFPSTLQATDTIFPIKDKKVASFS